MSSAPRTCTNSFSSSFPAAPQGRGTGTFLIFLCFCIAKSPSIWVFPVSKTAPTLVCRSSFFHVVKMTVPNSALPVFTAKNCPGQAQGGLSRDSERFLRETAPGGHFLAAELFSTDGDLSACKEGFRDGRQPGAEAFSRFRRIPPRNSIGIRAARSHKERKLFALFICARQRIIGAAAHQVFKLIAAGLSKGIPRLRDRHIPIAGYRQRHIAVEGTDPGVCRDAALRSGPSQSSSGI